MITWVREWYIIHIWEGLNERIIEWEIEQTHPIIQNSVIHSFLIRIHIYLSKNAFKFFGGIKLGQRFF